MHLKTPQKVQLWWESVIYWKFLNSQTDCLLEKQPLLQSAQHTESWAGLSSPEVPLWIIDKGQCRHASLSAFGITQYDPDAHAQCPALTRVASAHFNWKSEI